MAYLLRHDRGGFSNTARYVDKVPFAVEKCALAVLSHMYRYIRWVVKLRSIMMVGIRAALFTFRIIFLSL